jgi:hypothetical protein
MIDYQKLFAALENTPLASWLKLLPEQIAAGLSEQRYGDLPNWRAALAQLPTVVASELELRSEVRIGAERGYKWETLWEHADNKQAKQTRKNANVLLPGDRVRVPKVRIKKEDCETEQKHRFRKLIEPSVLRICCKVLDEPLANKPYTLIIEADTYEGTTDADGKLEEHIPCSARAGKLTVGEEPEVYEFKLAIGDLNPIDNLSGIKARLNNLGYAAGPVTQFTTHSEWPTKAFRLAVRAFQLNHGLKITGIVDSQTKEKLLKVGI